MSQDITLNSGNSFFINTDTSKIFLGFENRYEKDAYVNNSTYDPQTLLAGTVMGRIAATGAVVPLYPGAPDGSQFPVGILANELVIDAGDTMQAALCQSGDVNEAKIVFFYPGTSLDRVESSRTTRDWLTLLGIKLVLADELSDYDNS